ncbi:response regulator [Erythrobacter sp. QSSC1-22B]|uniref:response regulator n=1 Tax=Erythrobacter sp. QSSC1-22B TaxID=1860125 RepID=UPI0018F86813|nr:response regulator [Erythrobacter sp. QSSC1-22B]
MSHALIIEDEFLLAFTVEEALQQLGYSTFEIATTKAEAIAAAEARCPDLIVADHRILDGTGTEAVLTICSDKVIPVVFVTGSEPEVREHLPDAFVVPKPLTLPQLEVAVKAACERPFTLAGDAETGTPSRNN